MHKPFTQTLSLTARTALGIGHTTYLMGVFSHGQSHEPSGLHKAHRTIYYTKAIASTPFRTGAPPRPSPSRDTSLPPARRSHEPAAFRTPRSLQAGSRGGSQRGDLGAAPRSGPTATHRGTQS